MCGIVGWVLSGEHRQNHETLVRLNDLMNHRAPTARDWQGDTAGGRRHQISFGYRRLSIIDVEGGTLNASLRPGRNHSRGKSADMRILHLTERLGPGGKERQIVELLRGLFAHRDIKSFVAVTDEEKEASRFE